MRSRFLCGNIDGDSGLKVDGAGMPLRLACPGENAISLKASGDFVHAQTLQVFPVNAPDDFCLFRIDDQVPVVILGVSEEAIVLHLQLGQDSLRNCDNRCSLKSPPFRADLKASTSNFHWR